VWLVVAGVVLLVILLIVLTVYLVKKKPGSGKRADFF